MTAYLILASPGARVPDDRSAVIADRFAPLAFLVPVIWLLFNRLWLESFAAALVFGLATWLSGAGGEPFLGFALNLALSAITALEGRNWRAAALERRGWRLVDVVESDDPNTAFEIHAARTLQSETPQTASDMRPSRPPLKPGRPAAADTGAIGMVPVGRN